MRRTVLFILALFLIFTNLSVESAPSIMKREIQTVSSDGFNIMATLSYPKVKSQKEFKTVVLLHSIGYNSQWWGDLPKLLLDKGYAVLAIDLRGHGNSVYNSRLSKISWKSMKDSAYAKYPKDVIAVIDAVKAENSKKIFFNNWAIVGADIGASAGVLASDKLADKPKTIVMVSPVVKTKGLFIPVSMAHLDNVDFLTISGKEDYSSIEAAEYLHKFAQAEFVEFVSDSKTTGMLMLKNAPATVHLISEWVSEYLN